MVAMFLVMFYNDSEVMSGEQIASCSDHITTSHSAMKWKWKGGGVRGMRRGVRQGDCQGGEVT